MRAPVAWLRDFIDTDASPDAFAAALTARGFTVDGIAAQATPQHIVIGRVEALERHPNADRLQVSRVDVGSEQLQIVTGATNVHAGDKVPIALVGAEVFSHAPKNGAPSGETKRIERSTLRGIESNGMMCSPDELALPGEYEDGILIMEDEAQVGQDFWRVARYGDAVLDIDVPSNRGDGLAIIGLAREAAAGLHARFRRPEFAAHIGEAPCPIAVAIEDESICRRLLGQYFAGVKHRRTPMWMVLRLQGAGMRSINWFVDVSNYVQMETGQPLHFYDADTIRGARIVARSARSGERVTTLDGIDRSLEPGMPVIADGDGPVGIAGVMGGAASGVTAQTRNLFVESPNFVGARIRRASIALGLRTEGALRHEKDLPLELPEIGRRRAAEFLVQSGGKPSQVLDVGAKTAQARTVNVRPQRVNTLLGSTFSLDQMRAALTAIEIQVSGDDPLRVTVPFWRTDITLEEDVIEEVARGIGYADIAEVRAVAAPQSIDEGVFDQETSLAERVAAIGYREIVSLSLQGARTIGAWERSGLPFWQDVVPIVNPMSEDYRILRPSLLPGLLSAAAKAWPGPDALRLFEVGHIFRSLTADAKRVATAHDAQRGIYAENGVLEWRSLAGIAVFAEAQAQYPLDQRLLEVKGDAEAAVQQLVREPLSSIAHPRRYFHPGAAGNLLARERVIAKFGRLHPKLARAYDLPLSSYAFLLYLENIPQYPPVRSYQALPRFPATRRDIAVVVAEAVTAEQLSGAARSSGAPYLVSVAVFDEYRGRQVGEGKKSIALTVILRRDDTTITDEEANASTEIIVRALQQQFDARLRV